MIKLFLLKWKLMGRLFLLLLLCGWTTTVPSLLFLKFFTRGLDTLLKGHSCAESQVFAGLDAICMFILCMYHTLAFFFYLAARSVGFLSWPL